MGKKTQKTQQTNTNQYGWQQTPNTADIEALRGMKATVNPSIPFIYANRKNEIENSYKNPLGAYTTPAVRDAATRASGQAIDMEQSQAVQASQSDADNANYMRQAALAEMTAPRLVQTGGTMNGTQTQSGGFWSGLLNSAVQGASGAMM